MRRVVAIAVGLALVLPTLVSARPAGPPTACKMLTLKIADFYMTGSAKRMLHASQLCGYASGQDATAETLSLHVIGPLPTATAKANYKAAFAEAMRSAATARRLRGLGPADAFGTEDQEGGRSGATLVFLAGHYTGAIAISAPGGSMDAEIGELGHLLKRQIWPRWTRRRP